MATFYSKLAGGFYPTDMRAEYVSAGSWPADAVEVTDAKYAELMNGQAGGMTIAPDAAGRPVLTVRQPLAFAALKAAELATFRADLGKMLDCLSGIAGRLARAGPL